LAIVASDPANPSETLTGTTVLVVDDEPDVLRILGRALRGGEWTILEASSVREAEALLAAPAQRIDLMLTDVVLSDGNGCKLATRARELRPALKLLFMSGYGADTLSHHGFPVGGFLTKPFRAMDLRARIRAELERSSVLPRS
jgi:DNA-binding response OmpR family regulator